MYEKSSTSFFRGFLNSRAKPLEVKSESEAKALVNEAQNRNKCGGNGRNFGYNPPFLFPNKDKHRRALLSVRKVITFGV